MKQSPLAKLNIAKLQPFNTEVSILEAIMEKINASCVELTIVSRR